MICSTVWPESAIPFFLCTSWLVHRILFGHTWTGYDANEVVYKFQ